MIVTRKEKRIQYLLRLAELCSTEEDDRRIRYMDEIERLIFDEDDTTFELLSDYELDRIHHPTIYMFIEHCVNEGFSFEEQLISNVYELYKNFCRNIEKKPESKYMMSKIIRERFNLKTVNKRLPGTPDIQKAYRRVNTP